MKNVNLCYLILLISFSGIMSEAALMPGAQAQPRGTPPDFNGDWQGSIRIPGEESEFKIRIEISGNNARQSFSSGKDGGWREVVPTKSTYQINRNNAVLLWMNEGSVWSETQVFSLTYVNPNSLDLVWSRHVSNLREEGDNNTWHLFGVGTLTKFGVSADPGILTHPKFGRTKGNIEQNMRVVRGLDWEWGDQDGEAVGTVIHVSDPVKWVSVKWDSGVENTYRWNLENKYDLKIISPEKLADIKKDMLLRIRKDANQIMGNEWQNKWQNLLNTVVKVIEVRDNGVRVWNPTNEAPISINPNEDAPTDEDLVEEDLIFLPLNTLEYLR